jgi:hypothetical protein
MDKKEEKCLQELLLLEDLAEKKSKIYSRLLMDVDKAKKMETLSLRHASHKKEIEELLYGKEQKDEKKGAGTR